MQKRVYLHLILDHVYCRQFVDFIRRNFDKDEHVFAIIDYKYELKHFSPDDGIEFIQPVAISNILTYKTDVNKKYDIKAVFIHYFDTPKARFLLKIFNSSDTKLFWCTWGGDMHSHINACLCDDKELQYFGSINQNRFALRKFLAEQFDSYCFRKIFKRLDYVSMRESTRKYFDFSESVVFHKVKYPVDVCSSSSHEAIEDSIINRLGEAKYKILIGNSGTPENNHFTSFKYLERFKDEDILLVTPLSYGDAEYITAVKNEGEKIFGDKFLPLLNFYPLEDYNYIVSRMNIALWNHVRSQGLGNVRTLLQYGVKLYIRDTDFSDFVFLRDLGIVLEDISKLEYIDFNEFTKEYSEQIKIGNRDSIQKYFGISNVIDSWEKAFEMIDDI